MYAIDETQAAAGVMAQQPLPAEAARAMATGGGALEAISRQLQVFGSMLSVVSPVWPHLLKSKQSKHILHTNRLVHGWEHALIDVSDGHDCAASSACVW